MCDFSGKLIAWLDHEIPEGEAADVERHVQACAECRSRLETYQASERRIRRILRRGNSIEVRRRVPRWMPVVCTAGAAAAAAALFLALPRRTYRSRPPPPSGGSGRSRRRS